MGLSKKYCTFAHMIELEKHIEILLLNNDCIIVPGLGGFVAHYIGARYDKDEELFFPPTRTLGFNPQLTMNDSLLAQAYIEAYDISYPEAMKRIEDDVEEIQRQINNQGSYELHNIGTLSLNNDGNMEFQPCEAGVLTPSFYGLTSFAMPYINNTEKKPNDEAAITIRMSTIRNFAAAAIVIFAMFLIPPAANNWKPFTNIQQSSILTFPALNKTAIQQDVEEVQPTEPIKIVKEAPAPKAEKVSPQVETGNWTLVLASHISKKNAETFINTLQEQGFTQARIFEKNNVVRVVYGQYLNEEKAREVLKQQCGNSYFTQAWVLEIK